MNSEKFCRVYSLRLSQTTFRRIQYSAVFLFNIHHMYSDDITIHQQDQLSSR